ncbi:MAG: chemotaxis protein CheW [Burkholderiales bacterium]
MDPNTTAGGIDFSALRGVFFEEASEHLAAMEMLLVKLDPANATDDDLNAIFRAAHSIKGGAATFGYQDMAEVTHWLESLLDRVRRREIVPDAPMIDTLLAARDYMTQLLDVYREGGEAVAEEVDAMCARVRTHLDATQVSAPAAAAPAPAPAKAPAPGHRVEVSITPVAGQDVTPEAVTEAIAHFGAVVALPAVPGDPALHFQLDTRAEDAEILSELEFIVPEEQIAIQRLALPEGEAAEQVVNTPPPSRRRELPPEEAFGIFDGAPGADPGFGFFEPLPEAGAAPADAPPATANGAKDADHAVEAAHKSVHQAAGAETSIRVAVEKVDALINLVGELVITQAMLAQNARTLDPVRDERLLQGLAQLERNTRALQESVMSVRMTPIGIVFNRFPRVVRDLAARLGKNVRLTMEGEATELDKGLIERIVDPLTHLVRNSLDHGVEMPDVREARGKPPTGTVHLRAFHRGGSIVIEVSDDGGGLDRERILAKARERGMNVSDAMTDGEVWSLIYAAGFSTADVVTDVSGRGVGMDVVSRNVIGMGGSIDIDSVAGQGTTIAIRLPLTLAIMDGMSIAVGSETYIIPLASVVESLQVTDGLIHSIANKGLVAHVRGEHLPVLSLHELFPTGGARGERASGIVVIVEADKKKAALLVDELLGQHQVVVKSLDRNYKRVRGVSGATIMGDGRVAIILDVAALVRPRMS